ncbi:MAG: Trp biosynthesis-associated membrane protein, partial [Nocardiopsaceae bacterium]|nr:Trp biosynthesis-associated membrane protein [Nocardiopsaceae bacterium]
SGTAAGSTTSGSSPGSAVVLAGSAGHAVIGGAPWRAVVLAGALLIFAAGLATVLRGTDWPVMSSRYELPRNRPAGAAGAPEAAEASDMAETAGAAAAAEPRDSASMWETLSGGEDPTR